MIEGLERAADRDVSRETFQRLAAYVELLKAGSETQNLISATTLDALWNRHILDSAQLLRFQPHEKASWVDVGSGAGLPGIVLSILGNGPVTLVEPRRLRADFLRYAVDTLRLDQVRIEGSKIERVNGRFDVITGRAVAALPKFLGMCAHLSTKKTVWALPKGRSAESELADAQRTWQGVFHVEPSVTDADSRIIVGTEVRARRP